MATIHLDDINASNKTLKLSGIAKLSKEWISSPEFTLKDATFKLSSNISKDDLCLNLFYVSGDCDNLMVTFKLVAPSESVTLEDVVTLSSNFKHDSDQSRVLYSTKSLEQIIESDAIMIHLNGHDRSVFDRPSRGFQWTIVGSLIGNISGSGISSPKFRIGTREFHVQLFKSLASRFCLEVIPNGTTNEVPTDGNSISLIVVPCGQDPTQAHNGLDCTVNRKFQLTNDVVRFAFDWKRIDEITSTPLTQAEGIDVWIMI